MNLKEVSDELKARYIVEGSVRKGGQRVRITAQLIDAEQDHHLWSEKWDKNLEDIFDIQDEVSASIAGQINPTLEDYETERVERIKPTNYNAWETYLKSLHIFNNRNPSDHEDIELKKALKLCEEAIKLDAFHVSCLFTAWLKFVSGNFCSSQQKIPKRHFKDML